MTNYWQVTTQFERENDRGRIQKVKEIYLVDAMTGTEAESKTYRQLRVAHEGGIGHYLYNQHAFQNERLEQEKIRRINDE